MLKASASFLLNPAVTGENISRKDMWLRKDSVKNQNNQFFSEDVTDLNKRIDTVTGLYEAELYTSVLFCLTWLMPPSKQLSASSKEDATGSARKHWILYMLKQFLQM